MTRIFSDVKFVWGVVFPFLFASFFISCHWKADQTYMKRHAVITAEDSTVYYDSMFSDAKYRLDTFFTERYLRNEFNGVVLVAYRGRIVFEKAYGVADLYSKDSLTVDRSFQLASVSKTFTSTAILQLCQQGKLSLDDTLGKFFPGFPFKNITVKMLLCHRSGLGNYINFTEKYFKPDFPAALSNDSLIALMYKLKPKVYYQPGKKYDYSNTGFALLASIVEKVTAKKFDEYVQENIFNPCGMKDTYVYTACKKNLCKKSVNGYEDDYLIKDHYHNGVMGDKGIYSTTRDLLKFDRALRSGKILSYEWQQKAYTRAHDDWEGQNNYGLGWRLKRAYDGDSIVYHTGWWKGFRTNFIRNMSEDKTIITLDNVKRGPFIYVETLLHLFKEDEEEFGVN